LIGKGAVFVTVADLNLNKPVLYALDPRSGESSWQKLIPTVYPIAYAAYDKGELFVVNYNGQLQSIRADNGQVNWLITLPNEYAFDRPPSVSGGHVYLSGAGEGGTVYSVDEATGVVQWMSRVETGDGNSPAVGDGAVFVSYPLQYYAFNQATGGLIWHYDGNGDGGGGTTPVLYRHRLYVRDSPHGVVLDSSTGQILGSFDSSEPPVFFEDSSGKAYIVTVMDYGPMSCYELDSGKLLWSFSGDGQFLGPPLVVNGMVVEGSHYGALYFIDGPSGNQLWSTNLGGAIGNAILLSEPGAAFGKLFVPAGNKLFAFASQ
jgi:outer membrane protein assembly factor BamB